MNATATKTIRIDKDGAELVASPADYLGDSFHAYLGATKAAGLRFDKATKTQRGGVLLIGLVVRELKAAGFEVSLAPELSVDLVDAAEELGAEADQREKRFEDIEDALDAQGITFFEFQRSGVQWLIERTEGRNPGALLADDMGLGKTLQAIAVAPVGAPVLILCPAAVKGNWKSEIERFRPDLAVTVLAGSKSFRWPHAGEAVIINYDVLSGKIEGKYADAKIVDRGEPKPGTFLIADEVHLCKNWKSIRAQRTGAVANMVRAAGGFTAGLTGTPLVNRPMELWQVLSVLGLQWETFGGWNRMLDLFGLVKDTWGGWHHGATDPLVPELLKRTMLHRVKEDVLKDLPAKRYADREVVVPADLAKQLNEWAEKAGININEELKEEGLAALRRANDAFNCRKAVADACIPAMVDFVEEHEGNDTPLIVFSAHRAPIDLLATREGWITITGDTAPEKRTEIVAAFQRGEYKGIGLTIGAGGVGLTLTHASNILFVDLDWTPAGNSQAEDRAYRIGQENAVLVTRLVLDHPVVHRVHELLEEKAQLIREVISSAKQDEAVVPGKVTAADLLDVCVEEKRESSQRVVQAPELGDWPSGRFAVENSKGELRFFKVDRPEEGSGWDNWVFVSRVIGGAGDVKLGGVKPDGTCYGKGAGADKAVNAATVAAVLRAINAEPLEAAKRYGRELGVCGGCGRTLTDENSRREGIGPICAAKYGV
jgi:hypothetical protein